MKRIVCGVVLLTLILAVSSFALEGKVNILLGGSSQLAGQQLPRGEYKVVFTGDGKDVQVTLTSADGKTVVKAAAKLVDGARARKTAVVTDNGAIIEILLGGKTQSLVF